MKIIYCAEDGKEFEKKTDCLLYERTLNLYYENTIQKDKIRRNFADALSEYEVNEIARILEYGLSKSDLSELAKLHKANHFRAKIEDLLTTDNFHTDCDNFVKENYDLYIE